MVEVGDTIRIIEMEGEPQYAGKEGVVESISTDPWGDLRLDGTWGGCALYPFNGDKFELIKKVEK